MMNKPEKTRRFLPVMLLLWACSALTLSAQNWQEHYLLNQDNHLQIQRNVLFNGNVVRHPDPSIGSLTTTLNTQNSTWTVEFTPVVGAEGIAEFIIEYFPNQLPPAPKIESFRVHVSSSHVFANKDYLSVAANSVDNELLILANDTISGSDTFAVTSVAAVKNGTASLGPDGQSILFTPDADFEGMAYLTYVACDNLGACANAEVSICVSPSGNIPSTDTIYLSTHSEASVVAFTPLPGFTLVDAPGNGDVTAMGGEAWEYDPFSGYAGTDEFVLELDTFTRVVIVDVYYQDNANSFVNADMVFTRINESVSFNVLANDVKAYPIDAYTTPQLGTLEHDSLGVFTYTPPTDYFGAQEFTYTTCFLSNCETGRVIIYVGDMIPENTETYDLVTSRNVPLVLNYEIPLNGYSFVVHAQPEEGEVTLYNAFQVVGVACSDVEGYDLMVYEPPIDYVGNDYFEVVYCIDGGNCYLVKVNVTVSDDEEMPCPCVDHCVWPGDADGSGQVDLGDLLSIGWQTGMTGPTRDYPDNTYWMGQSAVDWETEMWGMNSKYADSDGDGLISGLDAESVSGHYLRKHKLIPDVRSLKADYTFELIPLTPELDSGDLTVIEISIGSDAGPVLDMHGIAFSLNLPVNLIDTSTIDVQFYNDSWLAHDAASLQMVKRPSGGRLDAAYSRTSGKPATGIGGIGIMTFIVIDDFDGFKTPDGRIPLEISVNSVSGMASSGLTYDVDGAGSTIFITPEILHSGSLEDHVILYPNPSNGNNINVAVNGNRTLESIEVYDLSGSLIRSFNSLSEDRFSPDLSSLENGLYLLRITTSDGVVSKKVEIFK